VRDLAGLTAADFEAVADSEFEVIGPAAALVGIRLAGVYPVGDWPGGDWPGGRRPFSLRFRGPSAPVLPQATYSMRHGELGEVAVFITQIAADADSVTYEAVFS
jgi:hypothetical protein